MRNQNAGNVNVEELKAVGSTRTCLAWTFRCCSFCGIFSGVIILIMNLMQVGELEFGNPEGYTNITGHKQFDKHVNTFMDSHFYEDNKNTTLLPNYEAIAIDYPTSFPNPQNFSNPKDFEKAMHNLVLPIGRVIYTEGDARFFVALYFIVSLLTLAANCVCWRTGSVNFVLEADTNAILAIQRGAVNQNDRSSEGYGKGLQGTVGFYSGRVQKFRNWILMLVAAASLVDTSKLYFQAKAV